MEEGDRIRVVANLTDGRGAIPANSTGTVTRGSYLGTVYVALDYEPGVERGPVMKADLRRVSEAKGVRA